MIMKTRKERRNKEKLDIYKNKIKGRQTIRKE